MTASTSASDAAKARLFPIWLAALAGLLIAAAASLFVGGKLSTALFDRWQLLAPRDLNESQVRIVMIDSESLEQVGPWPWPRYYLARLVEEIASGGAKLVAFDMVFPERDALDPGNFVSLYPELPESSRQSIEQMQSLDDVFAQVIGQQPVVLGRVGTGYATPDGEQPMVEAQFHGAIPAKLTSFRGVKTNLPDFEFSALGAGLLNGPPDEDGTVRGVPLLAKARNAAMPGLALEAARVAAGATDIDLSPGRLAIRGRAPVPMDDQGRMRLRFGRIADGHIYSAANILRQGFKRDVFRDKIVFLALGAEGTTDIVTTPIAAEQFGVMVQAQATDAILRGAALNRPGWLTWAEWAAGIVLSVALYWLLRTNRVRLAIAAIVIVLGLPILSFLLFDRMNILADAVRPVMLAGGTLLGFSTASLSNARRERERLREALIAGQIEAAAAEGELQAARNMQTALLPSAGELQRIDRRIDIAVRLEPARAVGGDFFDAIRLDSGHVALLVADVTGKGAAAALMMSLSKALINSALRRSPDAIDAAIGEVNADLMLQNEDAPGLTLLVVVLDPESGRFAALSAGHDNPMILSPDGGLRQLKLEGGPPLCIADYPYPVEQDRLGPGETLVMLTDGVSEAQNRDGALFGGVAVQEALRTAAGQHAEAAIDTLVQSVEAFVGDAEPFDDLTVLAVRWMGAAA